MKKSLKHVQSSHVWHYPNIEKSHRLPAAITMSMCGVLYRNAKQLTSYPLCRRCLVLEGFDLVVKPKLKLPKSIREQSFEPPEAHDE